MKLSDKVNDVADHLAFYLASHDVISNRQEAEVVFSQLAAHSSSLSTDDIHHIIKEVRQKRNDFDQIED
ncbi:hypothetical protein [Carnobacterium sp.]|uniref:hypothetical protein n=1 Tax=Carnobacterium sp. TaxID=48221 RepID=UPI0028A65008|nr:hypothetical protein [Carnobacterium sp.]